MAGWADHSGQSLFAQNSINDRLVITKVDLKIQCSPAGSYILLPARLWTWTIESSIRYYVVRDPKEFAQGKCA